MIGILFLLYNDWDIVYYENDSDEKVTNNTLKYGLQSVGLLHSIEFTKEKPIFKLHYNKDFIEKYNGFFDNCRLMNDNILTCMWWVINITDLFNIIYLKDDKIPGIIYINVMDHPIIRNDNKHPFEHIRNGTTKQLIPITVKLDKNIPIYCWPAKKGYNDIPLPFHDIWMFFFEREFGNSFNISNYRR